MKNVTYIALIAAFIFGAQPQDAFSANDCTVEMEKGGEKEGKIVFDSGNEVLLLTLQSENRSERATVYVAHEGSVVATERFIVTGRAHTFEMDLAGLPGGAYTVKVVGPTVGQGGRFMKK